MTGTPIAPRSPEETARILQGAAVLIQRGWTQQASARDRSGNKVNGASYTAFQWDAGEAIFQAAGTTEAAVVRPAFQAMTRVNGSPDLVGWNDAPERTKAEVVAAFLEAARQEAARASGPASPQTSNNANGRPS